MDDKFERTKKKCEKEIKRLNAERRRVVPLGSNFKEKLIGRGKLLKVIEVETIKQKHELSPAALKCSKTTTTTTDQQEMADIKSNDEAVLLVYPKSKGYSIYKADLDRLQEGRYLNDTIVNVVFVWFQITKIPTEWQKAIRILDSQWYDRVSRGVDDPQNISAQDRIQQNIKEMHRWYPSGHPFDCSMVAIPICVNNHWFALLYCRDEEGIYVTAMDSLNSALIKHPLQILNIVLRIVIKIPLTINSVAITVPIQRNGNDCGLHLIHNITKTAEYIIACPEFKWSELEAQLSLYTTPVSRNELWHIFTTLLEEKTKPATLPVDYATILQEDLALSDDDMPIIQAPQPNPQDNIASTPQLPVSEIVAKIPPDGEINLDEFIIWGNKTKQYWELTNKMASTLKEMEATARAEMGQNRKTKLCFKRQVETALVIFRLRSVSKISHIILQAYV